MPSEVPNTRINAVEQIETALKTLAAHGYDVKSVWAEHNAWLQSLDARKCTDEDRKWAQQMTKPAPIVEHFVEGEPEVLTAARCHVDRQYTLSPGQRDLLRDRYGLTPTLVVVATNVALFPESDVIWSITLKSVDHVDPRRRRHVLNEVVLCPAAEFFREADRRDKAREEDTDVADDDVRKPNKKKEPRVLNVKRLALEYAM